MGLEFVSTMTSISYQICCISAPEVGSTELNIQPYFQQSFSVKKKNSSDFLSFNNTRFHINPPRLTID